MLKTMPDQRSRRVRAALIALAAVVAFVAIGAAVWAVVRPNTPPANPRSTFTPAEETSAGARIATPSVGMVATSALGASTTPTLTATTPSSAGSTAAIVKFAFHLGRTLYVANEDASRIVPVKVPEDVYRLAPDGTAVAVVRSGRIVVVTVGSGTVRDMGPAVALMPVWTADSNTVLFVRSAAGGARQVWRAPKGGSPATYVGPGEGMAVSPDGRTIGLLPERSASSTSAVGIVRDGAAATSIELAAGSPVAVALSNERAFVSVMSPGGVSAILSVKLDGSDSRRLVTPRPDADKAATFGRLMLSPGSARLGYTVDGDDGYSRLWVVPAAGGNPVQIASRRDTYPLGWTGNGTAILFIEGNAFQGEQTALWRARPDGLGRKMLVGGARL